MKTSFWLVASVAFLCLSGCSIGLYADPEGLVCDPGGVCPNGYVCGRLNTCTSIRGSGGGGGGSGGGVAAGGGSGGSGGSGGAAAGGGAGGGSGGAAGGGSGGAGGGDACGGVSCTTPPGAVCKDVNTLTTFANAGTCSNGQCSYKPTETVCMNGCLNSACQNQNLCAANPCNTPPAPTCMGSGVRTFQSPGMCNMGTGVCTYNPIDTPCANGCSAGTCLSPGQTLSQTMPRVRFAVSSVDQAPGSMGTHVVVVGNAGNIMKWDGTSFSRVTSASATNNNFNSVWFSGANSAVVVGSGRSVARYNGTSYAPMAGVPGSGSTSFTQVHGRDEQAFTVIDGTENFWQFNATATPQWKTAVMSQLGTPATYKMAGVFVDAQNRARMAGQRTTTLGNQTNGVVHYVSNTPACVPSCEDVDTTTSEGFGAIGGPATDGGTLLPDAAFVGRLSTSGIRRHNDAMPYFDSAFSPPLVLPASAGIIAITGALSATRQTYFLTRSTTTEVGHLYRYSAAGGVDSSSLIQLYFDKSSMGRTESGGVIVAETDSTNGVNNIYRRNSQVGEMLDLGESWTAVSSNAGTLVLASGFGDVAFRAPLSSTWQFRRGPVLTVTDLAAQNGSGVLLAAKGGKLERMLLGASIATATAIPTNTTSDFNSICRVSDSEAYAVGNAGIIRNVSTTQGTSQSMGSGSTKNLLSVDCPLPGTAIACGQSGTVLRLTGTTWAPLVATFPVPTVDLTSCKLVGNVLWAAGDNAFYKIDLSATTPVWQQLAAQARLTRLVIINANEVYALSTNNRVIVRFDGNAWSPVFSMTTGSLAGGGQVGGKVVYAGSLGVVVEGQ